MTGVWWDRVTVPMNGRIRLTIDRQNTVYVICGFCGQRVDQDDDRPLGAGFTVSAFLLAVTLHLKECHG